MNSPHGRSLRRGLRRGSRDRPASGGLDLGPVQPSLYELLRFPIRHGISAAHALAAPILEGDRGAASRYIEFLSAGSSDYPVEVLKKAGADMRGPEAIEKCFEVLGGLVDRLERLTAR